MADETVGLLRVVLASDSAQFTAGMDKADAAIGAFTRSAQSVGRSLANMVRDFDGTKIIGEANRIATAVEQIGGASKLTEAEKARLNATIQKALDKYAALGREAPKALQDLATQTSRAEEKTSLLTGAAGKLFAAFSVAAIANVANKVLELTGNLTDLQGTTGINTDGLQVLNYALGQSGVSLEQAGKAAVVMSRNLVNGNAGAAGAVKTLGLNIDALIAAGPEQAFLSIGSAIAAVPDPMQRAALATEIFGRTGADLLPGFTTNMAALGEEARRSGAIISADLVAAGDAAGDSLTRLQGTGTALIANVFLPMAPGIEAIANWLGTALTTSLRVAREALDALVTKGMEMELWLREMALSIAETVKAVPGLGRVFGKTSEDIEGMRLAVQESKDALAIFTAEGAKPAETAVVAVTAAHVAAAPAVKAVAAAHVEATTAVQQHTFDLQALAGWENKVTAETARLAAEQKRAAQAGLEMFLSLSQITTALQQQAPVLATANSQWVGFAGSVQQNTASAGASTGGFLDKLKGLFGGGGGEGGGGKMSQLLNQIGPQFAAAFLGPGSAGDKMKAFATAAAGTLMGMIPGVGPWLQQFAGPIVEGLTKLASKAKDILSGIFGGPSADERKGREVVAGFEDELAGVLTAQQKAEAGGEDWKETVIAIRDAYMAMGRTEEEALADAKRLWESSKQGAEAAARVIEEIRQKMKTLTTGTHTIDVEYRERTGPGGGDRDGNDTQPEDPGHRVGTIGRYGSWFKNFGSGLKTTLHGMEAVLRPQDAMPFAASVLAGTIPDGGSESTTTNSLNILPVIMGSGMSAWEIGRAAVQHLATSGLPMNESGIATAFEQVIDNYMRSYARA